MAGDGIDQVRRDAAIIPVKFDYVAPATLEEAVGLLAGNPAAMVVAGGQALLPAMTTRRVRPSVVVDVGRIDGLRGISVVSDRSGVRIGALTTLAEIAANDEIRVSLTALAEAAEAAGDAQVRNRATIGGSLADAHPAGDVIAAVIALGGSIAVTGPKGAREIAATHFVSGAHTTALTPGEIITQVELPAPAAGGGSAYIKQRHPGSGYAICGVAAALTVGRDGKVATVRIVATGAAGHPGRLEGAEEAASGLTLADAAPAAAAAVGRSRLRGITDLAASGAYRKHLAGVLAARAITLAGQRSGGA